MLDPGRGRTETGYLWAIARDGRPWPGADPPAVSHLYAPGRGKEHAEGHLADFSGVLQVDGYAAYGALPTDGTRAGGPVTVTLCWGNFHRCFYDIAKAGNAPIAAEALECISASYSIEAQIRGHATGERRTEQQPRSLPIVDHLKTRLEARLKRVAGRSAIADAMHYGLSRWESLGRFLDHCRIEIDTNVVERSIRQIALSRKNALVAGSNAGGANWATVASLIEVAKLSRVTPNTWLTDALEKLVDGWPQSRIDDLMPWAYAKAEA